MAPELFEVSVPGSLMLMGEHAVLHGKQAIVCAVAKRLHMQLIPNAESIVTINDTRLGTLSQNLSEIHIQDPFKFVLCAILKFKHKINAGFTLEINSEFSSVIGFGSSAAVTVATIGVLNKWLELALSDDEIFTVAKQVILEIQGSGSGADVAASVYGGVVSYSLHGAEQLPIIPDLTAIYCGYKTPTPEVISIVNSARKQQPAKFSNIFQAMHDCAQQAVAAIQNADWQQLGKLFFQHHNLQAALGTSNKLLDDLVQLLSTQPQIYGAKISGAGLGDCVIGLGAITQQLISANDKMLQFLVNIDPQGLTYASN